MKRSFPRSSRTAFFFHEPSARPCLAPTRRLLSHDQRRRVATTLRTLGGHHVSLREHRCVRAQRRPGSEHTVDFMLGATAPRGRPGVLGDLSAAAEREHARDFFDCRNDGRNRPFGSCRPAHHGSRRLRRVARDALRSTAALLSSHGWRGALAASRTPSGSPAPRRSWVDTTAAERARRWGHAHVPALSAVGVVLVRVDALAVAEERHFAARANGCSAGASESGLARRGTRAACPRLSGEAAGSSDADRALAIVR